MFYNFNDFNGLEINNNGRQTAGGNGKRPVTSGALKNNGMRTQNNFYKNKTLIEDEKQTAVKPTKNIHDQANPNFAGDRVPTRER